MSVQKIPVSRISPDALQGVIEEFISRDSTDHGEIEVSRETIFRQLKDKLETGSAVLIFEMRLKLSIYFWQMILC
jgi:uncharacterized protein YheU (UPF0270 family)